MNASLQYLVIAFSFGYGVLLFDDRVVWTALLGMLLIVGAGLSASYFSNRPQTLSDLRSDLRSDVR